MTNGEKIRQLSNDELADFLVSKIFGWLWCDNTAPVDPETKDCLKHEGNCLKCCQEWLDEEYHGQFLTEDDE